MFGRRALVAAAAMAALPSNAPHWSSRYVGRRYVEGEFDCGELARAVQLEVFGKTIRLPTGRDHGGAGGTLEKFRAMSAQIDACKDDVARRVDVPREGDGVLLKTRGYRQHIGIHCVIAGEAWVLHATDGAGQVVLQRARQMPMRGLTVEGYYRWI